jgi:mono/diheme cytochrome c family protein
MTICGVAVTCAGVYLGMFHGGFRGDVFNERLSSPELLFPEKSKTASAGAGAVVAEKSLAEQGKAVYEQCQACHQPTGLGMPNQFPPLAKSEFVNGGEKRMIAILLKGVQGPITVEGNQFNGTMPAWESVLSDKKIASVASYVRASFGNTSPEITPGKVAAARKEFSDRKTPWSEKVVLEIPADATLPDVGGAPAKPAAGAPAPTAGGAAPAAAPAGGVDLIALGKAQYGMICVACHQPTGLGIPGTFPPLAKSEYVNGDPKRMVAIILKGVQGPISVCGTQFPGAVAMPPQGMTLDDKKIAGIVSFVRKSFGNDAPGITPDVVAEVRKQVEAHAASWTEAELKSFGAAPAAQ